MPEFIRLDLFPATVRVGEKTYEPSRAIVADESVHVYMDSAQGPTEVYTARMDDFSGSRTVGYAVTTADDDTVSISRASGCGCGSRLRGYRPFPGVPLIRTI